MKLKSILLLVALLALTAVAAAPAPGVGVETPFTPDVLIALGAAVLALLFDRFKPLQEWYDRLEKWKRPALMAVLLLALTGLAFGGVCIGVYNPEGATCTGDTAWAFVLVLLDGIAINQGTHFLFKPTRKA